MGDYTYNVYSESSILDHEMGCRYEISSLNEDGSVGDLMVTLDYDVLQEIISEATSLRISDYQNSVLCLNKCIFDVLAS